MKSVYVSYANYNQWANKLLASAILGLSAEQQQAEIISSFPSLHKTLLHMVDAESIWWQRMKLSERVIRPSEQFSGDTAEVISLLQKQDKDWCDWMVTATDAMLQHEFIYYNTKKEKFKQPISEMLLHLFNHNSYHRGQLVTMLRQLGVTKIPATDYIIWARKNG